MANEPSLKFTRKQLFQHHGGEREAYKAMEVILCAKGLPGRVWASLEVLLTTKREPQAPLEIDGLSWEDVRDLGLKLVEASIEMKLAESRHRDEYYRLLASQFASLERAQVGGPEEDA